MFETIFISSVSLCENLVKFSLYIHKLFRKTLFFKLLNENLFRR